MRNMRLRYSISALIFLLLPLLSAGQHYADGQSLLWRITGNGLQKPSYLFGTMHIICADDYVWTDKMKESYGTSDKVCFEMNLADPSVLTEVASGLADGSGKELQSYFSPVDYAIVKRYVKDSLGLDIMMLQHMKPIALEMFIGAKISACPNPVSYEERIMKAAGDDKKEVLGLETPKEQIDVLEKEPSDSVIKEIMQAITQGGSSAGTYNKLTAAYKHQDLPALLALINSEKDPGEDMGALLDERNKKWVPRIAERMKGTSVFFAVGAGHLWGNEGIISLLRRQGYTVTAIR